MKLIVSVPPGFCRAPARFLEFARRKAYRPSATALGADLHGIDELMLGGYDDEEFAVRT
jgi:hypothetical protein